MKKLTLSTLFILISLLSFSQNPRKDFSFGLSGQLGGPAFILSASIDAFVIPTINIELGTGTSFGLVGSKNVWGGLNYHFFGNTESNFTPYLGIYLCGISPMDYHNANPPYVGYFYVPIGIQLITNHGFTLGLAFAEVFSKESMFFHSWGFKIGCHIRN